MKYWSNREMDSKHYWLDFFEGGYFYLYLKNLFITMTEKINFVNLNKIWNRTDIRSILKPGDFVFLQGAFYFKSITKNVKGLNQLKLGYRRAKGIRLEFEIDAFYCNSSSSKSHLSGRNVKTVYCLVRSISYELQQAVIKCTALAIGTGLNRLDSSFMFEEEEIMEPNGLSEIIHG
jgi:virulence-associated protein VapD